jgi:chromosomal replication initiation ATPase DnaA
VKPTAIQTATARYFGITVEQMCASSRSSKKVVTARHVARFLERELTGESYPALAKLYGRSDHTAILASVKHVAARLAAGDEKYKGPVEAVAAAVKAEAEKKSTRAAQVAAYQTLDAMSCPTCGAPIIKELQRQVAALHARVNELSGVKNG